MNAKSNRIKADADKIIAEAKRVAQPGKYTAANLKDNRDALNAFKDDIVALVMQNPPQGMDKDDVQKTITELRKNDTFMRNLSQAYANSEEAKAGIDRNTFIQQFVAQAIMDPRYASLREKDIMPFI